MDFPPFRMLPFSFAVLLYVFFAYCLYRIAEKCGERERAWWAWVPIAQVLLMLRLADFPWWGIFLLLVPIVNIAFGIYIWIKIARRLGRSALWGALMFVPGVDLIVLGILAFADVPGETSPGDAS